MTWLRRLFAPMSACNPLTRVAPSVARSYRGINPLACEWCRDRPATRTWRAGLPIIDRADRVCSECGDRAELGAA